MNKPAPIKSVRYCRCCMDITKWKLDHNINHSFCTACGKTFGLSKKDKILEFLENDYKQMMEECNSHDKELLTARYNIAKRKITNMDFIDLSEANK